MPDTRRDPSPRPVAGRDGDQRTDTRYTNGSADSP